MRRSPCTVLVCLTLLCMASLAYAAENGPINVLIRPSATGTVGDGLPLPRRCRLCYVRRPTGVSAGRGAREESPLCITWSSKAHCQMQGASLPCRGFLSCTCPVAVLYCSEAPGRPVGAWSSGLFCKAGRHSPLSRARLGNPCLYHKSG